MTTAKRGGFAELGRAFGALGRFAELRLPVPEGSTVAEQLVRTLNQGPAAGDSWIGWIAAVIASDRELSGPDVLAALAVFTWRALRGDIWRQTPEIVAAFRLARVPVLWRERIQLLVLERNAPPRVVAPAVKLPPVPVMDHWHRDALDRIWHPTHVTMWSRCPLQLFYRYIEGIVKPPAARMIRGSAVDTSVTVNLDHKIETGELAPLEEVAEAAANTFSQRIQDEGVLLNAEELATGRAKVLGMELDRAVRAAKLHATEIAPNLFPKQTQRSLEVQFSGRPWKLGGTLDVDLPDAIRDTKSTERTPKESKALLSMQLTHYSLMKRVTEGSAPSVLTLDHLVVNAKTETVVIQETTRGETDWLAYLERVERMDAAIAAGHFSPADPEHWGCSEKWCGYWHECPHGARGRSRP